MPSKQPTTTAGIVWKNIKENPIKSIAGIISILTFVFGSIFWIDSRYVHAGAMDEYKVEQSIEANEQQITVYTDVVEDIELKEQLGSATDFDKAKKPKLLRKIENLEQNIRDLGGTVD